jgi:hypothetical protein
MNKNKLVCRRYPGKIWIDESTKRRIWTQDQLIPESDNVKYVSLCTAVKYFYNTYGITLQEYYNIVVYGDINYQPICALPDCTNPVEFRSLVLGYLTTCCKDHANILNSRTDAHRHAASEFLSSLNYKNWTDEIYRDKKREEARVILSNTSAKLWSDPEYRSKMHAIQTDPIKIRDHEIYHKGKPDDICYFYLARTYINDGVNWIKIGITNNIDRRCQDMHYDKCYALLTTRLIAANIECSLALLIKDNEWNACDKQSNEWFTINHFKQVYHNLELIVNSYGLSIKNLKRIK